MRCVRGECEEEGERQEKENRIVSQTTQVPVKNSRVVTYNRVGGISAFVRLDYEFSVEVVEGRHGSGLSFIRQLYHGRGWRLVAIAIGVEIMSNAWKG